MGFLKLYVRFRKNENDVKFDKAIEQLLNKPKETMGIVFDVYFIPVGGPPRR